MDEGNNPPAERAPDRPGEMPVPAMVERVADAMKKFIETPLLNPTEPPSVIDLQRVLAGCLGDIWKDLARAAIEAMRDYPLSPAMLEEFRSYTHSGDEHGMWRCAIDAALK